MLNVWASQQQGESGPLPPVEYWPQPEFDAATGVTLFADPGTVPTISGGILTFFNDCGASDMAEAVAVETITAGTYLIEYESTGTDPLYPTISGESGIMVPGTDSIQIVIGVVTDQIIRINNFNEISATMNYFRVSKL